MTLNIDVGGAFRSPDELRRLAAAVRDADPHDETEWVEWKSAISDSAGVAEPLLTPQARQMISVNILGFANRSPVVASQWAQGYGYLLVGVEPGNVAGVVSSDREKIYAGISSYVPGAIGWRPEYIDLDGRRILVVIVDPPRQGDPIHTVQKEFPRRRAGQVLVRHPGKTEQASPADIVMLTSRAQPPRRLIHVDLTAAAPIETTADPNPHFHTWASRRRDELTGSLHEPSIPGFTPQEVARLVSAANPLLVADQRSRGDYAAEVDTYLRRAVDVLVRRAIHRQARHPGATLRLELHNPTDTNLADVELQVTVTHASTYPLDLLRDGYDDPALPEPPTPLGSLTSLTSLASLYGQHTLVLDTWSQSQHTAIRMLAGMREPARPWTTRDTGNGFVVCYHRFDVRPHDARMLGPVPLAVAEDRTRLRLAWTATAGNIDGRINGELDVNLVPSTFDLDSAIPDTPPED